MLKITYPALAIIGFMMFLIGGVTFHMAEEGGWYAFLMLPLLLFFPLMFIGLIYENQQKKE